MGIRQTLRLIVNYKQDHSCARNTLAYADLKRLPERIGFSPDVIPLVDGPPCWQSLWAAHSGLPRVVMGTIRADALKLVKVSL